MNTVPFDFCQRVLVTRKCCEGVNNCYCSKHLFAARKWNQPNQILISFHVGAVNGKWRYGFRNPKERNESPTMEELKKFPQMKNLRIGSIEVVESYDFDGMLKHDVVDLEKLLNFVSFLANEPWLYLRSLRGHVCSSPHWETVFRWLAKRWFSYVSVGILKPSHYPILEKQFSRRTPSEIYVHDFRECAKSWSPDWCPEICGVFTQPT